MSSYKDTLGTQAGKGIDFTGSPTFGYINILCKLVPVDLVDGEKLNIKDVLGSTPDRYQDTLREN